MLALGERGTPTVVAELLKLQGRIRHNGLRTRIGLALDAAASKVNLSKGQLLEQTIPTGGLDADGQAVFRRGATRARVTLTTGPVVTLAWQAEDGWAARPDTEFENPTSPG